jgi:transcriptional regulator with XRE-family HTH domain
MAADIIAVPAWRFYRNVSAMSPKSRRIQQRSSQRSRNWVVNREALVAARMRLVLDQDALAAKTRPPISVRTIERLEAQEGARATGKTIQALAEALGVEPQSLIAESSSEKRHRPMRPPSPEIDSPVLTRLPEETEHGGAIGETNASARHYATVLIDLYKEFRGRRKALHAVWNDPPGSFDNEVHDEYRRNVLHFWELVASLVKADPDIEKPLLDRYRDYVSVWERLKPIQINATGNVFRKRFPKFSAPEAVSWATRDISASNIEWLYNRWKSLRRQPFRDDS